MPEIKCSLCGAIMTPKKIHGHEFWECPDCGAETWPYEEHTEKAIRKAMYPIRSKKRSGGRRKRRYRTKKPGEKWVPWWLRR